MPEDPDLLLTTAQAAALCGVSPVTIRTWQRRGALPRAARGWYRLGDVLDAERTVQAGGQGPRRRSERALALDVLDDLGQAQPA